MYGIKNDKVILRDFIEFDIEKRIHWEKDENEWQLWDGPWEYEGKSETEFENDLCRYIETMKSWVTKFERMPGNQLRTGFQIVTNNINAEYIGWCNFYRLDQDYNFCKDSRRCAVGIDIPAMTARGKGYAVSALTLFISYLLDKGETELYTQTWSGNKRMICLAEKLGFEECMRNKDMRTVRGQKYDGLSFILNLSKFKRCTYSQSE